MGSRSGENQTANTALDSVIIKMNELQSQSDAVKSRCRCGQVDEHGAQIQSLKSGMQPGAPAPRGLKITIAANAMGFRTLGTRTVL